MTDHAHNWQPIPLVQARYSCACGAEGMRVFSDGSIRELRPESSRHVRTSDELRDQVWVQTRKLGVSHGGQVERAPMLHETERIKWRR